MKMFKKLMAVALVGVMALSMLTGCAVTSNSIFAICNSTLLLLH